MGSSRRPDRDPAPIPQAIIAAAMMAYDNGDGLVFPLIDFVRLSWAIVAALEAEKIAFRAWLNGDMLHRQSERRDAFGFPAMD